MAKREANRQRQSRRRIEKQKKKKQREVDKNRSRMARVKSQEKLPIGYSETVSMPEMYRGLLFSGRPLIQSEGSKDRAFHFDISGCEVQLWWYPTQEARAEKRDGEQVSVLEIQSCEEEPVTEDMPTTNVLQSISGARRFYLNAMLIEFVQPDSMYGKWLRSQKHQGSKPLDGIDFLETTFEMELWVGVPTKRWLAADPSSSLVPKVINILDIGVHGSTQRSLSDLQVDRIWELFIKLRQIIPIASGSIAELTEFQRRELQSELSKRLEQEKISAQLLWESSRHVQSAKEAIAELERKLVAKQTLLQELREKANTRIALCQAEVECLRRSYEQAKSAHESAGRNVMSAYRSGDADAARKQQAIVEAAALEICEIEPKLRLAEAQRDKVLKTAPRSWRDVNLEFVQLRKERMSAEHALKSLLFDEYAKNSALDAQFEAIEKICSRLGLDRI